MMETTEALCKQQHPIKHRGKEECHREKNTRNETTATNARASHEQHTKDDTKIKTLTKTAGALHKQQHPIRHRGNKCITEKIIPEMTQ